MSVLLDLTQIVLINLSLAADNALVVGMAVTALPPDQRKKAMTLGIAAATVLRIFMALFAVQLLHITGLMLAGGLLLAWVAWKMVREFHHAHTHRHLPAEAHHPPRKRMSAAIWQIFIADISMSLDNVLGVVGIARDHMVELVIGLVISVVLMGAASSHIARLAERHPKIVLIGVVIVLYTAVSMIIDGGRQISLWE